MTDLGYIDDVLGQFDPAAKVNRLCCVLAQNKCLCYSLCHSSSPFISLSVIPVHTLTQAHKKGCERERE